MKLTSHIAKHFREVFFGGNWTYSNLKDHLADVTWQEAITKVDSFNTIATLVFHMNYYVDVVSKVMQGEQLTAKDEYSFLHPPINNEADWKAMVDKTFSDAEKLVVLIEQMPEAQLWENIGAEKYGVYYRNLHGMIEHTHYHLGQLVLIKKMLLNNHKKE